MHRTVLYAALAVGLFTTAAHADDDATADSVAMFRQKNLQVALYTGDLARERLRLVVPANVKGKGVLGAQCHADTNDEHVYVGKYTHTVMKSSIKPGEPPGKNGWENLSCCSPANTCLNCNDSRVTCFDGKAPK